MALLFQTGWDFYTASIANTVWTNVGPAGAANFGSPGRLGTGQYAIVGSAVGEQAWQKVIAASPITTVTCGFAWQYDQAFFVLQSIHSWWDSLGNALGTVAVTPSGQIGYFVGKSTGGACPLLSAPVLANLAWAFIEVQVVLSATTTGSVTIKVNGVQVGTVSGVVTAANSNGCTMVGPYTEQLSNNRAQLFFDDYYCNGTGGTNSGFNGDGYVFAGLPTADGRLVQWSKFPNTGSNWQKISDNPPDGDTSYIFDNTVGHINDNAIAALPSGTAALLAVYQSAYARKDNTPSRSIELGLGNGTTEVFGSGQSLNTSYVYAQQAWDTNPLTSAPWAVVDWTTLQASIKVSS